MFDKTSNNLKILEKGLEATYLRNDVISQNIANKDTPNYKRKSVAFEEYLNDAMQSSFKGFKTNSRHLDIGGSDVDSVNMKIQTDNASLSYRLDGNNVDIESEMAASAKNAIRFNTIATSLTSAYQRLKSAISEGRK